MVVSAAEGHEDKGLIECLMVKCAKALVYCAGDRESYGKDAEAAIALSLGKPIITKVKSGSRAWNLAALMHRAFAIDVLACPHCGGRLG
jgi:hypothetical protein